MRIELTRRADAGLASVPKRDAARIAEALQQIAHAHPQRLSFVKEMAGMPDTFRARKGDYRAIYELRGDDLMVVLHIGNRKDVYR